MTLLQLQECLVFRPSSRISAANALTHPFFKKQWRFMTEPTKTTKLHEFNPQKIFLWGWNVWVHYKMWDLSGGLASTVRFDQQYYKTNCCSQIHAVFAQNEAPLCYLELLFEINTTVSTLMLFWVRLFLQSCFFFFKMGNYDLFLLLKKMMVLEHNTPVFMFVFFTIFFFYTLSVLEFVWSESIYK